MANNFYGAISLIGGGTGSLDAINGSGLADLDAAFVQAFGTLYPYTLDDDSGLSESSPSIISPDTNPGTKRWVLQSIGCNNLVLEGGFTLGATNWTNANHAHLAGNSGGTITEASISDLQSYLLNLSGSPLSELSDTTITGIASGELLKWSGSAWINNTLAEAGISATGHAHTESDISDLGTLAAMVADNLSVFAATTSSQLAGIISDETGTGSLVFGSSPTIVTPTIASMTNAQHDHLDAAGGGTITEASISDLQTYLTSANELGSNLTSSTNDILSDTGTLLLGGTGNTNNENLTFDFESASNAVILGTTSGVSTLGFGSLSVLFLDGEAINIGNSSDATFRWLTDSLNTASSLQLGLAMTGGDQGGYFNIMERADWGNANRTPLVAATDPTLRIYSRDATSANDYIELYHDQTDAVIDWGVGALQFNPNESDLDLKVSASSITNALFVQGSDGFVGVGTGTPSQALDLIGSLELETTTSSTTGVIYKGADRFIHNYGTENTFVGVDAGNFATDQENTCVGYKAGNALAVGGIYNTYIGSQSGLVATTGDNNCAMGRGALLSLVTGSQNNAMGAGALYKNTGDNNNAMGYNAMFSNIGGTQNCAVGPSSLYGNTTGNGNAAIGQNAGRYIAGGATANETSDYCTFIGALTDASADGVLRETVLGYNAIGKGSDTAIIGAEGVNDRVYLSGGLTVNDEGADHDTNIATVGGANSLFVEGSSGFVGIGTGTPSTLLEVGGVARVTSVGDSSKYIEFTNNGSTSYVTSAISPLYFNSAADMRFNATTAAGDDIYLAAGSSGFIKFRQYTVDTMTIDTSGNVGIGEISPAAMLDVYEDALFNSSGGDHDFNVGSVTTANSLFVQGSDGFVGVGTGTPNETLSVEGIINVPKASGNGIQIDTTSGNNDWGWHDIIGAVLEGSGGNKPTQTAYQGAIEQLRFTTGKEVFITYHMPHDYVEGTDIHFHVHWSCADASTTGGTVVFEYEASYSKGHAQAAFSAPVTKSFTSATASATQYFHEITETQLSAVSPTNQLDTDDLEVDGVIMCRLEWLTNNLTGGTTQIFIHNVDIHYQSSGIPTKQKAPDFYT